MRNTLLAGLVALVALLPARAFAEGFTISYWCGPPASFLTAERFAEVKEANFTLAFPTCGSMTVEQNRKMLDYCQSVGLKALIMDGRMVHTISGNANAKRDLDAMIKDYADHPALFGYHIVDEPGAGAFEGLAEVIAYLKEKDPKHPGFINLLPTYARDFNALGTKTYEEYVRKFAQVVKPAMISYDHYHFTNSGDRADFFENLETVRKVSLESGIPFWNIVLVTQHFDYRNLTEPELRYEAMQTLAYGAKGLLWFTYWAPPLPENPGNWSHALIDKDGKRDPHYEMVKQINADVLAFAGAMEGATSTEVRAPQKLGPPFTLGQFKSKDGRELRFIASGDYKKLISLPVEVPSQKVEQFNPRTKAWAAIDAVTKDGKTHVTLNLPPGGAALLRW
jgi:hypothetical protein